MDYSKSDLGRPDCLIIDRSVPVLNSRWSGMGTVLVPPGMDCCILMWLPRRLIWTNPCPAMMSQTASP